MKGAWAKFATVSGPERTGHMRRGPAAGGFQGMAYHRFRTTSILTLAGLALALGGCDRETPSGRAVRKASNEFVATTGGGTAPAAETVRAKTYSSITSGVSDATKAGGGEQAAAWLLTAEAQMGEAAAPAARASALEGQARATMVSITRLLGEWTTSSAMASVAEAFDPSAQLGELASGKAERETQAARAEQDMHAIERQVADLRAKAKEKLDAAAEKTAQYESEMARALKMSATDAAPVVREANKVRREADALRLAGESINADADAVAPTIEEARLRAEELRNQKKNLEAVETELTQRKAQAQKDAGESRTAATVAANQLDKMVGDLEQVLEQAAQQRGQAADAYAKASTSARNAGADAPAGSKMSVVLAQQAAGNLHMQRAQLLGAYAKLMHTLGNTNSGAPAVEPALPQAAKYAAAAKQADDQRASSLEQARSAYEAAASAVEGIRVQGEAKDRLTELAAELKRAGEHAAGKSADTAPETPAAPSTPPEPAPGAP